jgi:hypothetical protein
MENRYELLKDLLSNNGFIKNAQELQREFSDPRIASDIKGLSNHFPDKLAQREISKLVENIEADENKTPTQKYYSLLLGCRKIVVGFSLKLDKKNSKTTTDAELQILQTFKKILNMLDLRKNEASPDASPVTRDDTLFVKLYLMAEVVCELEGCEPADITTIFNDVNKAKCTTKEASEKLVHWAYDKFLHPSRSSTSRSLGWIIDIFTAYHEQVYDFVDLEPIKARMQQRLGLNHKHFGFLDYMMYKAAIALSETPERKLYCEGLYKSLMPLIDPQTRKKTSTSMNQTLDQLVREANMLYSEKNQGQETINNCKELLDLLGIFTRSVAEINSTKGPLPSSANSSISAPSQEQLASIELQIKSITHKIEHFSKDTKSLHWGKIIGLTLVTLGLGLLFIIPALALTETFFRREHPVTIQAHQLITNGQTAISESRNLPSTPSIRPGPQGEV